MIIRSSFRGIPKHNKNQQDQIITVKTQDMNCSEPKRIRILFSDCARKNQLNKLNLCHPAEHFSS